MGAIVSIKGIDRNIVPFFQKPIDPFMQSFDRIDVFKTQPDHIGNSFQVALSQSNSLLILQQNSQIIFHLCEIISIETAFERYMQRENQKAVRQ